MSTNRDESPGRSETPIVQEKIGDRLVTYPRDVKGGSWIFFDDWNRVLIVLNGAFKKHAHRPRYKKSRGLIAKAFYESSDTVTFIKELELGGIEPFTMIIFDGQSLFEFRWDENIKHVAIKDKNKPHIWSSCTLYSPHFQNLRAQWFYENLPDSENYNLETASYIHRSGTVGDPTQDYVMNRENLVRTVSISHLEVSENSPQIHFESLV